MIFENKKFLRKRQNSAEMPVCVALFLRH